MSGHGSSDDDPFPGQVSPAVVTALQQLSAAYWLCADETCEGIGRLFTEDGQLTLGSLVVSGRPAIETFFREREASMRAAGRMTRHAASGLLVTDLSDGRARVRSTVLVYSGSGALPLPVTAPSGIADFTDLCVCDRSGGWRFASRVGRTVFLGEGAPAFAR
jgi:hypothetical protein